MKKILLSCLVIPIHFLYGCAPASTALPTGIIAPSPAPSQAGTAISVMPLESASAPGSPGSAPTQEKITAQEVTFETPDGASLTGDMYGSGKTAVIFSMMGDCDPGWTELAQLTAAQGLMVLTYSWRDCGPGGPISEAKLVSNFVNDARGAIDFVRGQGAENVILAGASLGGIASAKLAAESNASGLIVFASPPKIPNHDFVIEASDLNVEIPKLFITADQDLVVPAEETRKMYEMAAAPREWQTYPGAAHGTDLFKTESGQQARDRILAFILAIAKTP